jgi:photosystem I P700 chlorophyll a apoprotein A1
VINVPARWSGHQIHISLLVNKLFDAGVATQEIPLPHELLFNQELMLQLYPSFKKGLLPFFTLNWSECSDFLTFKGGLNPITGSLWLSDTAHHHAIVFIFAGHMYRPNWGIGHSMKEILDAHVPPRGRLGAGHRALFKIITNSLHMQLGLALTSIGVATSLTAQDMYALPAYAFMAKDYVTQARFIYTTNVLLVS